MLEAIEKLLVLQDRDRKLNQVREELVRIEPGRQDLQGRTSKAQASLDAAKMKVKTLETARKELELEVISKKQQIDKYSVQQFQTKKNDEFKALGHEIDTCKAQIVTLDDKQLELMEQIEAAQKEVAAANQVLAEALKVMEGMLSDLTARETNLKKEETELNANRANLISAIDESVLSRYERLLRHKGGTAIVGISHGVCGGCHMRLPPQALLSCQGDQEIVNCPNCGRMLYYTRDMDLAVAD